MLNLISSQNKVCFCILIIHPCKTSYSSFRYFCKTGCHMILYCTNTFSIKNGNPAKNKLATKGCRKMFILTTASSSVMLDQVYLNTAWHSFQRGIQALGYKRVLYIVQSQDLKTQVFEDICFVYLTTGVNAGLQMNYLKMHLDHGNFKYI